MEKIENFIEGVKEGKIRGDYAIQNYNENITIETSVGSFEYGNIKLRVFVKYPDFEPGVGKYYRRLYKYDNKFAEYQNDIVGIIESYNETDINNSHEWQINKVSNHLIPEQIDDVNYLGHSPSVDNVAVFEDTIKLRDDVTIGEAIMTNRKDGMTRSEFQEWSKDS